MLIQIIPFSYPLTEKVKDGIQKFASELHPEKFPLYLLCRSA